MKNYLSILCILLISVAGCNSASKEPGNASEQIAQEVPQQEIEPMLAKSIAAHGGLENWRAFRGLSYDLEYARNLSSNVESFLLDLHSRHERIRGKNLVMGYDGKQYWQKLLDEKAQKKPVPFYINLQSYFFSVPFILADPGVVYESLGKQMANGKEYFAVKCGFGEGIGLAPEDEYVLYIDPKTYLVEILLYTVTYFDRPNDYGYRCLHYGEYQDVAGLKVPKVLTSYVWELDQSNFGERGGTKTFFNVEFDKAAPDPGSFAPLEGSLFEEAQ